MLLLGEGVQTTLGNPSALWLVPWACISPELFPPPVLSATPSPEPREGSLVTLRCQAKLHPLRSASRLLFSFHKDGHTLQDRGPHPELCIPGVEEGYSGLYWCEMAPEGGQVQKQSPQLEGPGWSAPVSRPVLTLHHGSADPAVGDMVQLLCEAQRGSPPVLYLFYLSGKILGISPGNHSAPHGGAVSPLFPVKSEQDAGIPSCKAENSISRERSEPKSSPLLMHLEILPHNPMTQTLSHLQCSKVRIPDSPSLPYKEGFDQERRVPWVPQNHCKWQGIWGT
uniref:Ig-like domain-containing protein n=1 Tax=Theropithecus gelada TaxID=9565 RepID=A0A8D2EJM2_THEGE